jgi:hypothetical protein
MKRGCCKTVLGVYRYNLTLLSVYTLISSTDTMICMSYTDKKSVTTIHIMVSVLLNVHYGYTYIPLIFSQQPRCVVFSFLQWKVSLFEYIES